MKLLGTAEMTTARSLGIRAFLLHHRENPVLDSRSLWPNTLLVGRHHSMAYSRKRSYRPETFCPVTRHKGWHIKRKSATLTKLGIGPRCIFPSMWSRSLWYCARLAAKDGLDLGKIPSHSPPARRSSHQPNAYLICHSKVSLSDNPHEKGQLIKLKCRYRLSENARIPFTLQ